MSRRHLRFLIATFMLTAFSGLVTAEEVKQEKISLFDGVTVEVPATFKSTKPKSRMLKYEFKVGEEDKAARLTMMAAGGGVDANIKRWKGQFAGGDPDAQKSEKITVSGWDVHVVDCSGTFAERMGGGPFAGGKMVQREDYAMVGAIIVEPEGRLFFVKMIGPADVVKPNREAFVTMLKSMER